MDDPRRPEAFELLDRLAAEIPADRAKAQIYLTALKDAIERDALRQEERDKLMREYEEAYEKLTAPANRIGIFLRWLENQRAVVALGDTEYVAMVDPAIKPEDLTTGSRVLFNEAYAVIGVMPAHEGGALVKVSEALEDGRLRVGADPQNQMGRIVHRAEHLAAATIKKGDEVRVEPFGKLAVEHFPGQEVQDYFVEEVPEVPWSAIGGQEDAIALIRDTIEHPLLYPELYERFDKKPVKGILLYGPPGCGKTLIGKATAYNLAHEYSLRVGHEVKEYFMHISGPKILNMWLGETERMVREIFEVARQRAKEGRLVVIFMDEAESVLRTRSSGRWLNISNTVVPQFCAELDGMVSLDNVVLILTSNRPDYIDPAVLRPERIDRKVKVRRPDRESSRAIFAIYLHDRLPIDPELLRQEDGEPSCARKALIETATAYLFQKSKETEFLHLTLRNAQTQTLYWGDLVSGALIKSVVDRAKDIAIRRAIAEPNSEHGLRIADLEEAIGAEYRENEIFPKSDVVDDWLKLIDVEPENVVAVRPVTQAAGRRYDRSPII